MNSYTKESRLIIHKPKCENYDITSIRTSSESNIKCKKHFQKKPLHFRIYADFGADNEIDISSICNKTTNIYKQNPLLNGYRIESEMEDVLQSGYHQFLLGFDNVDRFLDEVIKFENKMSFYFRNTKKDIIVTQEKRQDYENNDICRFCEKKIECDKIRDHCHLTDNYRGPAHSSCKINVTQDQSFFIPFMFHIFSNYDCHLFF